MRGSYWPWIGGALLVLGLVLHQVPLLLVAFLLFLVTGVTRLWEKYSLTRLEYRRRLSTKRAFSGDEIYLDLEVDNRKILPLPWVEIVDEMPEGVTFIRGRATTSYKVARVDLVNLVSLGWYQRVRRRYQIRCDRRGSFTFGPTRIRSGDLFGFTLQEMEISQVDRLTVYPRIVPLEQSGIPSMQPLGDLRTRRRIFQDPILTLGVRDYHYGDSLKTIHWKTTARTGQLRTKVFEPTTSVDMGIMLDVRTVVPPAWGVVTQLQELGIITATAIASDAMASGYRVGLYVNQRRQFTGQPVRIPPSQHADQMVHMLEALAQIHGGGETMSAAPFVSAESRLLPWGSTVVVVTAVPTEALLATLLRIKRAGRSIALVIIGQAEIGSGRDGMTLFRVSDDVPWQQIETINLREVGG